MILPAFGIVSNIIPTFSRKKSVWLSLHGLCHQQHRPALLHGLGAPHVLTGLPVVAELFFMYATMLIAVPTGVKVFNWVATMWRGSLTFETPMLFAIAFITLFTIGGFSGLMLAMTPAGFPVSRHLFRGGAFPLRAGHRCRLLDPSCCLLLAAEMDWACMTSSSGNGISGARSSRSMCCFPHAFCRLGGHARRMPDYALQFADFNMLISLGGFAFGLSQLLFVWG